jgi:hypothetical protein
MTTVRPGARLGGTPKEWLDEASLQTCMECDGGIEVTSVGLSDLYPEWPGETLVVRYWCPACARGLWHCFCSD